MQQTLRNYTDNKYIYGLTTMELITNENDPIVAYRIIRSPIYKYGTFVTLSSKGLVKC